MSSAYIALHARLGGDPVQRQSQSGNAWATASLAANLDQEQSDSPPQWFGLVAFGKVAETLCRHAKGDLVSVSGRLQMNRYRDREGNDREQLQIVADTVISARSVRPGGRRQGGDNSRGRS